MAYKNLWIHLFLFIINNLDRITINSQAEFQKKRKIEEISWMEAKLVTNSLFSV